MTGQTRLIRVASVLAALGCAALVAMVGWFGIHATLARVTGGLHALPAAIAVHLLQLFVCALGWRMLLPRRLSVWLMFRARWVREAVNSLLPVASVGGAVVGARLLTQDGIDTATAGASVTADVTGEIASQFLFVLCGLALATTLAHAPLSGAVLALVVLPLVGVTVLMILAQALGLLRWVEKLAARLLPRRLARKLRGLQARLNDIYLHPARLAADFTGNFAGWSIGAAEVWVLLHGVGEPVGLREAYVIESLGLVGRSLAFAIPGGLAAQETGFVLACAMFGIPHQSGLALSLLKRLRELLVGVSGVLYWQWLERRVWFAR